MTENDSFLLALLIKPFAFLLLMALLIGVRVILSKHLPKGKIKDLLLRRIG